MQKITQKGRHRRAVFMVMVAGITFLTSVATKLFWPSGSQALDGQDLFIFGSALWLWKAICRLP